MRIGIEKEKNMENWLHLTLSAVVDEIYLILYESIL